MTTLAKDLRREAIARLAELAGYDERLDVDKTLARRPAVKVLCRQALKASVGDQLLLSEVRELDRIVAGGAHDLIDAVLAHGMPEQVQQRFTAADIEAAFAHVRRSNDGD